ncbi:MAG: hypothetical protein PHQ62_00545 [Clostridia bacterium]|nr:hypothetical protein [Clostridia bacterium]
MADKKPVYIRCPRCELNYCLKKDKYCSVCRAEMNGDKEALLDDLELELCPICKTNYIQPDEIMCSTCLNERKALADNEELEDEWNEYINRDEVDDYTFEDEETGEMASITDIDDDVLDNDLEDEDLTFDLDEDIDEDMDDNEDTEQDDLEEEDDFDQSFDDEDDEDEDY